MPINFGTWHFRCQIFVALGIFNAIIGIILGKTTDESTAKRADVNNDEEINIADVNFIINLILG